MARRDKQQRRTNRLVFLFAAWLAFPGGRSQAEEGTTAVEVYWHHSTSVPVPGAAKAVVLDENICQAETAEDKIKIVGVGRGETLVLVWTGGGRLSLLVRVVPEPVKARPPTLRAEGGENSLQGIYGPSLQLTSGSGGTPAYVVVQRLSLNQELGGDRLGVQGQMQDQNGAGVPAFNLSTMSVEYSTPRYQLSLADTIVGMNGGDHARLLANSPATNTLALRGGQIRFRRGRNDYGFFGGVTIPAYYQNLSAARSVFGFNFGRQQNSRLYLYSTTAGASVPLLTAGGGYARRASAFESAGLIYRWNDRWAIQSTGGASTAGAMAEGAVLYSSGNRTAYLSVTRASADFPLNQLQLLPAGRSSLAAGAERRFSRSAAAGAVYQYSSTQSNALFTTPATSDYFNPYLNAAVSERHRLTLNYTLTRNRGGLGPEGRSTGQRGEVQISSQVTRWLGNSAEFAAGSLSDPLQLNAAAQLSLRESMNFRIFGGNTLFLTLSQDRQNPSLVNRLSGEMALLSPALQAVFRQNPVAFVESANLTPEIRALLSNLQPTNTQLSLGGQLLIRRRLSLSPQVGYFRAAKGTAEYSNTYTAGYALTHQLTRRLQLQSSFSNLLLWDSTRQGLRRDTVFGFGCNVALRGNARALIPYRAHRGVIRGRVYRDANVNGTFNAGEPGFAGIRVDLSDGRSAVTDPEGRFEFIRLGPEIYRVTLGLAQFHSPVRVTSPTEVSADLASRGTVEADFGIVNFSRVQGNVFNDYLMNGGRQPDAPPIAGVRLTLTGDGRIRDAITDGSGDFEFDDLNSGEYKLAVDRATIPPNFAGSKTSYELRLAPNSTMVQEVPLQALRSISGRFVLMAGDGGSGPRPVSGAGISLAGRTATTDGEGRFVLRNLPAGNWVLEVVAATAVPPGVKLPSARVELPREPVQVEGAAIVISNPAILRYVGGPARQSRLSEQGGAARP